MLEHKQDLHIVPDWEKGLHRLFGCRCKPRLTYNKALSPVWVHKARKKKPAKQKIDRPEPMW